MNKLVQLNDKEWELTCENGQTFIGKLWTEKKVQKDGTIKVNYHVKLPENPSGRQYVNISQLNDDGSYEFENRTTEKRVMGWRDKMTPEEREEVEEYERKIDEIKQRCMTRGTDEISKLEREIERKMKELEQLRKQRG